MSDRVRSDLPLAIVICPEGIDVALDWLDEHDIAFALDRHCLVFLTNAYEAWKALDQREPSEADIVVQAYFDLDDEEQVEYLDLARYLRVRGWWVI